MQLLIPEGVPQVAPAPANGTVVMYCILCTAAITDFSV